METLNNAFDLYVCDLNRREKKTVSSMQRIWLRHIKDTLGKKNIKRIKRMDVVDLFYDISKSGKGIANRCIGIMSCTFDIAMRYEMVEQNPCKGIKRHPDIKRKRYCTQDELKRIFSALEIENQNPRNRAAAQFIELLIWPGCRKGELASATWNDLHGNHIILEQHKSDDHDGPRVIHLNDQAMAVINSLQRTGTKLLPVNNPKLLWKKIKAQASIEDLRLHDLRHTFATQGLQANLTLPEIGNLLGHKNPMTTMRYAHVMDETAKENVNDIGNKIFNSIQSSIKNC